jgi:hypothetical protein
MEIRKIVTIVEDTLIDGEKKAARPIRKAACIAVIKNPYAGKYEDDLTPLIDFSDEIGKVISERAVMALGADRKPESYGKAAIVGEKGELEHAAALLHPKLGTPLRNAVGGGKSIIPSAKKMGKMGDTITSRPLKDAASSGPISSPMTVSSAIPPVRRIHLAVAVTDGADQPAHRRPEKIKAKCEDG